MNSKPKYWKDVKSDELISNCPYCNNKAYAHRVMQSDGNMHYENVKVMCEVCGLSSKEYTTWYAQSKNPEQDAWKDWDNRIWKLVHDLHVVKCDMSKLTQQELKELHDNVKKSVSSPVVILDNTITYEKMSKEELIMLRDQINSILDGKTG